jgi:type II secretory ATPase GspE/PulE/Tfp pilus assembly ATPase PilB-like protein
LSPGYFQKFLGFSALTLDGEKLVLKKGQNEKTISFAEIEAVTFASGKINIKLKNSENLSVKVPGDNKELSDLLDRLLDEFNQYDSIKRSLKNKGLEEKFKFFQQCFNFKAKPYVWAAEILILLAAYEGISDIHFEPLQNNVKITFRKHGKVYYPGEIEARSYRHLLARLKYLGGCLSHIEDKAQEGAFQFKANQLDVRISTFPTDSGERLSLRFIQALLFNSLDKLGWGCDTVQNWRDCISSQSGLFIIAGAVGSGKTTALYATLSELARENEQLRVLTLEDPVEGRIPEICQSSLDVMHGLDLASAFKHLLRQDPDIMALGEIRDRNCLREALQAGLSGHKILATFHAGSIDETVQRLKQLAGDEYLVLTGLKRILHLDLFYEKDQIKARAILSDRELNK